MSRFHIRAVAVALPVALALVIAVSACGGGGEPEDRQFDLEVRDGKLILDPPLIKVKQGDTVTFSITADVLGDFHLHGYNRHAELEPGASSSMRFTADATGSFGITLHLLEEEGEHSEGRPKEGQATSTEDSGEEAEIELATFEVHPR